MDKKVVEETQTALDKRRGRRRMSKGWEKKGKCAKTHRPDLDLASIAQEHSCALRGERGRENYDHRLVQEGRKIKTGWEALLVTEDGEFDFFATPFKIEPRKATTETQLKKVEQKHRHRCVHVWKAEEHVHNKGKGKYQWYVCALCKARQKRNYNKKRKNKLQ